MGEGVELTKTDNSVKAAFGLMNRAMLSQQLRCGLPLRKWTQETGGSWNVGAIQQPDLTDSKTV
jgi:hypothetical protein